MSLRNVSQRSSSSGVSSQIYLTRTLSPTYLLELHIFPVHMFLANRFLYSSVWAPGFLAYSTLPLNARHMTDSSSEVILLFRSIPASHPSIHPYFSLAQPSSFPPLPPPSQPLRQSYRRNGWLRSRSQVSRYLCKKHDHPQSDPIRRALQATGAFNAALPKTPTCTEAAQARSNPNYEVPRPLPTYNMDGTRGPDNPTERRAAEASKLQGAGLRVPQRAAGAVA